MGEQEFFCLLPVYKPPRGAIAGVMAKLTPHEIRSIAVAAMVDPRSVRKAIAGAPLAHLTTERIKAALAQLGRADLLSGPTNYSTPPQAA